MNQKNYPRLFLLAICVLLLTSSCSSVYFNAPHPSDERALSAMDSSLIGTYVWNDSLIKIENKEPYFNPRFNQGLLNKKDSIIFADGGLVITSSMVVSFQSFSTYYRGTISDSSKYTSDHRNETLEQRGNYLVYKTESKDTLLNLTKHDRLFVLNGKYYLNRIDSDEEWAIY